MFEFAVRIILAGGIILLAGTTGLISFPLALGIAIAVGLLALAAHSLEERNLYAGAGAGLHTALEGFAIAMLLVDAGRAEALGFITLIPYAWAVARHRAAWAPGAFAAAFALFAAYALLNRGEPPLALELQIGAVLALGLALAIPKVVEVPVAEGPVFSERDELRGRFRALREAYTTLEQRARDDANAAALVKAATPDAMAQSLRDATSASGAALFTPTESGWEINGSAGNVPDELRAPARNARELQQKGAVLLFGAGRPVGAVWTPSESRDELAGISEVLSARLSERLEVVAERRRRQAAELRITLIEGGDSPDSVAAALAATTGADSVEFGIVGPLGSTALGRFGPNSGLPDALRHESGPGLTGWAAAGAPLVWIADARNDGRLDGTQALRARTSSMALVSLAEGRAYVWAAWYTTGAGKPTAINAMRAAEEVVKRWLIKTTTRTSERIAA